MKQLNTSDLFSIFDQGDSEIYQQHNVEDLLDNTFVLFGMVVRGVENYYLLDHLYTNRYAKQYDSVRENIKVKYFTNLIKYLHRIDVSQLDTVDIIKDEFGEPAIEFALNDMLQCFVQIEHYDKCATLAKFMTIFGIKNLQSTD